MLSLAVAAVAVAVPSHCTVWDYGARGTKILEDCDTVCRKLKAGFKTNSKYF